MKIIKMCENTVKFSGIELGQVFKFQDDYFIKIPWTERDCFHECGNAMSLEKEELSVVEFSDNDSVIPCECELQIIKEGCRD